ncbi:acid shock protein [Acidithiobacillus albertensis]|uniref:acid shock protein n=1 Tax=Acidithiobacillus albertensis TaxID=119978 RepID=UPI00094B0315|nr:acid shock protein [Acidithiobacillus albertensis]
MRKISLVLAVLMGLSGAAYGADWVQTNSTPETKIWLAPAPAAHQVWEKIKYSTPQTASDHKYLYDKIVLLPQADCKRGSLQIIQSVSYLRGHIVSMSGASAPVYPLPGTGGAQILHMLCAKK